MVPKEKQTPEIAMIAAHLRHITRRWHELGQPVVLEVVHLSAEDAATVKHVSRHSPDEIGLELAVEHIAAMNAHGVNSYAVVNPVDGTRALIPGTRASAGDIVGSFFHFADADDGQAAENIRSFVGPKCTFHVLTGTQPTMRPHVYWELEEPTRNLVAWRETQTAIAATLGTDPAVIDPPRIMRIAGTINWPKPKKLAKGYVAELTRLKIYDAEDRVPVTSERMRRAFAGAPRADRPSSGGFDFDAGGYGPSLDRERARIQALSGQDWHNAVVRLVASYVAKGLGDDEINSLTDALTLAGYTVEQTRREVQQAINGARRKGWTPDPAAAAPEFDAAPDPGLPFNLAGLAPDDLAGIQPRRWLYGRKLIRGFCSIVAAPGGVGKSSWTAAMAADMAGGINTMHDDPHAALRVWIYNLEDPRDETLRKIAAIRLHKRIGVDALARIFVTSGRDRPLVMAEEIARNVIVARPDTEALIEAVKAAGIDALIIDPFIRSHRLTENDNKHIDFVMDLFAKIAHEADCGILLVHHTRKGFVGGDADSIRGGSAMTSAARIAITLSVMSEEEAAAMGVESADRRATIRIDNAKSNLAPPPGNAEWIRLESVSLGNGNDDYPAGDHIQVATRWAPPDPWDGLGPRKVNEILDVIASGFTADDGSVERYSIRPQDGDRWVGNAILSAFPPGEKTTDQCKHIIKVWVENGLIANGKYHSDGQRKERQGVDVLSRVGEET